MTSPSKPLFHMYWRHIAAVTVAVVYGPLARKWLIFAGIDVDAAGGWAAGSALAVSGAFSWVMAEFLATSEAKKKAREEAARAVEAERRAEERVNEDAKKERIRKRFREMPMEQLLRCEEPGAAGVWLERREEEKKAKEKAEQV